MMQKLLTTWLPPLTAGCLIPFAFAPYDLWLLIFPAVWLLLYSTRFSQPLQAAFQGWLFGLGMFGLGVSWVHVSIHEHGGASLPLAIFLTAIFVAGIALFHALQFFCAARLTPKTQPLLNAISFILMWIVFEWVRTWFLTGFPWLLLGNSMLNTTLAGWAPVLGVYGVSLLLLFSATALYCGWRLRSHRVTLYGLVTVAAFWLAGWGLWQLDWTQPRGQALKVSLVQANVKQSEKWRSHNKRPITQRYLALSEPLWDSDIIIWPETALPYFKHQAKGLLAQLDRRAKQSDTALAMGMLTADFSDQDNTRIHNSFLILGTGGGTYSKQKLVPFGEYVPLEDLLRGLIAFFDLPMSDLRPGPANQQVLTYKDSDVFPMICYEVVYPDFVANYARNTELLVTVSNDSWFGTSNGPLQHLQIAQMRALETGKYVLRGTNNGVTAIIDPKGRVVSQAPQFEEAVLRGDAWLMRGNTPFVALGSWPTLLTVFALTGFCGWQVRKKAGQTVSAYAPESPPSTSS